MKIRTEFYQWLHEVHMTERITKLTFYVKEKRHESWSREAYR